MSIPTLLVFNPNKDPKMHELQQSKIVLGRDPRCDIHVENVAVSRRHCELSARGHTYLLRDLDTPNKTFVNGNEVKEHVLKDGDVIFIGNTKLVFTNPVAEETQKADPFHPTYQPDELTIKDYKPSAPASAPKEAPKPAPAAKEPPKPAPEPDHVAMPVSKQDMSDPGQTLRKPTGKVEVPPQLLAAAKASEPAPPPPPPPAAQAPLPKLSPAETPTPISQTPAPVLTPDMIKKAVTDPNTATLRVMDSKQNIAPPPPKVEEPAAKAPPPPPPAPVAPPPPPPPAPPVAAAPAAAEKPKTEAPAPAPSPASVRETGISIAEHIKPKEEPPKVSTLDTTGLDVEADESLKLLRRLSIGQSLGFEERYESIETLGSNELLELSRARDRVLDREVLVRTFKTAPAALESGLNEVQFVSRFAHPNLPRLIDAGFHNGAVYFTQPPARGSSLQALLKPLAGIPWSTLVPYPYRKLAKVIDGIAAGIEAAHAVGVLHLHLNPGDVVVDEHRVPVILNWEYAGADEKSGAEPPYKRKAGAKAPNAGAPATAPWGFLAPELAIEKSVPTRATDIYGLGGLLYVALCGASPNQGATAEEVLIRLRTLLPVRWPSERVARAIPAELERICLQALAPNAKDRYESVEKFRADLRKWIAHAEQERD